MPNWETHSNIKKLLHHVSPSRGGRERGGEEKGAAAKQPAMRRSRRTRVTGKGRHRQWADKDRENALSNVQ